MTRASKWGLSAVASALAVLAMSSSAVAAPPPALEVFAVGGRPGDITVGPDGNMWFTTGGLGASGDEDGLGRISADGSTTVFPVPNGAFAGLRSITAGPDGNLWVARGFASVVRIATDGTVTGIFDEGNRNVEILTGPNSTLWLTSDPSTVAVFDTSGAFVRSVVVTGPSGLALGADGNMWVGGVFGVYRITPDGVETTFTQGLGPGPVTSLTPGPDGNVWFAQFDSLPVPPGDPKRIGRITPSGDVLRFTTDESPGDIVAGPDGAIWFTERAARKVVRISADGVQTAYDLPATPLAIAAGPDAALWLTLAGGQVARFAPGPPVVVPEVPLVSLVPVCAAAILATLMWRRRRATAPV